MHIHATDPSVAMHRVERLFCVAFSSSFGAIGIDLATGKKIQQLEVECHSQHASRCGKRQTGRP